MAQRLGLSGKDITVCVIDTGVDVRNPTFGRDCPDGPQCRIAFGFDVETQGDDPVSCVWEAVSNGRSGSVRRSNSATYHTVLHAAMEKLSQPGKQWHLQRLTPQACAAATA